MTLDAWQEVILQAAMGERSDLSWAAKRVGISVARQNGKSQLLVARALAGVLLFGERKVVVSAHQQDTARESFVKLVEMLEAEGNEWLMDRVRPGGILNAFNREAVRFKNGAIIQFKARTGAGGRGFSSDCLLLDEAQRVKRPAWVSINSTMSARPNPQVWLLGTPPTREDYELGMGEVFESVRAAALAGESTATAWTEWGADPTAEDYDPASEHTRWQANPAWNIRINHEVVDGEYESYSAEEFAQDRLGVWLKDMGSSARAIPPKLWNPLYVDAKPATGTQALGVAFSLDGQRLSLAGAIVPVEVVPGEHRPTCKPDETGCEGCVAAHAELIDAYAGSLELGLSPLADWMAERWRDYSGFVLSGRAGASVLADMLFKRKVPQRRVVVASTPVYLQACVGYLDEVRSGTVTHLRSEGQIALDQAVEVTDQRSRSKFDDSWSWWSANGDHVHVEAVSLALYGARHLRSPKKSDPNKPRGSIL